MREALYPIGHERSLSNRLRAWSHPRKKHILCRFYLWAYFNCVIHTWESCCYFVFFLWSFVYSLLFWWLICSGYEPVYRARGTWGRPCHSRVTCFWERRHISECLGDEFDKSARFQKPTTVNEIEQRERDKIPCKENSTKYRVVRKRLSSLGWIPKHTNWNPWRWV